MKLYLYCSLGLPQEDVENIKTKLIEKGHIICDSFSDCDLILSLGGRSEEHTSELQSRI